MSRILILLFLIGCSGLEKSSQDKLRQQNAKADYIYRNADEEFYPLSPPKACLPAEYPWEKDPLS